MVLVPIVAAVFAPIYAPIPSKAAGWSAPPLPDRNELLPDFQALLDPLPIVVRDLPDAASQSVVLAYDAATLSDQQSVHRLLESAIQAIPVPVELTSEWQNWVDSILNQDPASASLPIPDSVLSDLTRDPRNGDRLSNLALAMYFSKFPASTDQIQGTTSLIFGQVPGQVFTLLHSVMQLFPESRGATLNTVALSQRFEGGGGFTIEFGEVVGQIESWLDDHPNDATALLLLLQLYERNSIGSPDHDTVIRYLARFGEGAEGAQAALSFALSGDLLMVEASDRPSDAPFSSRQIVLQALEQYDHALQFSDDPSIYTARAMALEQLGDIPSAIRAQQRALDLSPESVTSHIRLAQLYLALRGTESEAIDAITTARELSRAAIALAARSDGIRFKDVELRNVVKALKGYVFVRPERYFIPLGTTVGGAGGSFVSFDSIQLVDTVPALINSPQLQGISPILWAAHYAVLTSVMLGDPSGVEADLDEVDRLEVSSLWRTDQFDVLMTSSPDTFAVQEEITDASRMIAEPNDFEYMDTDSNGISTAIDAVRFAGLPERALAICSAAIEAPELVSTNSNMEASLRTCVAENAYLAGDFQTSQEAFETLDNALMAGYVAERRGNIAEAEEHYRREIATGTPDSYLAMLRLADMTLQQKPTEAIAFYDQVFDWITRTDGCDGGGWCIDTGEKLPLAYSNRGIARLQILADRKGNIDCTGDAWEACNDAYLDFSKALEFDAYNPVFLMNQAWAARLLGDQTLAEQIMKRALESDSTLYPVLNDLGVSAADSGDRSSARQYFLEAAAANSRYDLALWNLGVLNMRQGLRGIFRGQGYLARAIVQNPSLVGESLDFRTDERFYRVEINERQGLGAGWTFGAASSAITAVFGLVTMIVVLLHATKLVVRDKLVEELTSRFETQTRSIRLWISAEHWHLLGGRSARWLPVVAALAVLALTTIWVARDSEPLAATDSATLALVAVILAVVTHELGHVIAAKRMQARIEPTQWAPGTALALLLLPLGVSSGPYPGQKIVADSQAVSKWVYLAGPLANLITAFLAYVMFKIEPVPAIRLVSQLQFAAMGYALLPFAPLDGAVLARELPGIVAFLAGMSSLLGVLFALGFL